MGNIQYILCLNEGFTKHFGATKVTKLSTYHIYFFSLLWKGVGSTIWKAGKNLSLQISSFNILKLVWMKKDFKNKTFAWKSGAGRCGCNIFKIQFTHNNTWMRRRCCRPFKQAYTMPEKLTMKIHAWNKTKIHVKAVEKNHKSVKRNLKNRL